MGQNASVQKQYWEKLKGTPWNANRETMPKYSVLETVLHDSPDFSDSDILSEQIVVAAINAVDSIMPFVQGN